MWQTFTHSKMTMELISLRLLFFGLVPLCLFYLLHSYTRTSKAGFKSFPVVGSLPELLRNQHRIHDWVADVLAGCPNNTATLSCLGNPPNVLTANPANVEQMVKTSFHNFPKGPTFYTTFRDLFGDSLFLADDESWKDQRKTISPEFNTTSLRNLSMQHVASLLQTRLLPILSNASRSGQGVDLQDVLQRLTFDNICQVALGVDHGCLGGTDTMIIEAFNEAILSLIDRRRCIFPLQWKIKKLLDLGSEKNLRKHIAFIYDFAARIVQERMENKTERINKEDLLSKFIHKHETSPSLFLQQQVVGVIIAGSDSTSSALTSLFWLLSKNPEAETNILKELKTIRERHGKHTGDTYTYDELRDMHYLNAALTEAMRLYPPVPSNTRHCRSDELLPDGTFVRKGWNVTYNTYAMGRMESVWGKDCREFVPERWLDGEGEFRAESQYKYPVFHGGPRVCLGKDMAYTQMKLIAASVMESFKIETKDKSVTPKLLLSLTVKMKDGLLVTVRERSGEEVG